MDDVFSSSHFSSFKKNLFGHSPFVFFKMKIKVMLVHIKEP